MNNREGATVAGLRNALLRYLERHPHAADTLDGIGVWWLAEIQPKPSPEVLQEALDEMVATGKITRTTLVDGSIVYEKARRPGKHPAGLRQ